MKKVITLGEIMLRLSPPGYDRLEEMNALKAYFGGSEYNIAAALSGYGINVSFVTKLPNNEIGTSAKKQMSRSGIDTSHIIRDDGRMGIYFLENGYSIRPTKVIYDREHSTMATINHSEFDVDQILKGVDVFHVSGITLGINEEAAKLAKLLMIQAKKRNIKVSFDFNYRTKLWSLEEATIKFKEVLPYVDILFGNYLDFCNILQLEHAQNFDELDLISYYESLYRKMNEIYDIEYFVTSNRDVTTATHNVYQGILYHQNEIYCSKTYQIDIIDRVGTGDAFSAGFLYSYLVNMSMQEKIEFATASAAFKHTIPGDVTIASVEEIKSLMNSDSFGVQR